MSDLALSIQKRVHSTYNLTVSAHRWYNNAQPLSHAQAVHQAVVHIGLAQLAGKEPHTVPHLAGFVRGIQQCRIVGEGENWGERLRFPNANVMEVLLREAAGEIFADSPVNSVLSALTEAGENHPAVYKSDTESKVQSTANSLSLADGNIKFAVCRSSKIRLQHWLTLVSSSSPSSPR